MTTKTNLFFIKKIILFNLISLMFYSAFAATTSEWVIAAEKFSFSKGYSKNAVSEGSAEMLPVSILEKLNRTLERNILPDEKLERQNYKSRTERQSLYLQLSSEYRKRDALFLNPYTEQEFKQKLKEQDKEIEKIQKKIQVNLDELKELQQKTETDMDLIASGKIEATNVTTSAEYKSEKEIIQNFFHNIFIKDESIITQEKISIYQKDFSKLYNPSEHSKEAGYFSNSFEREITSAGINTLITGRISGFGDYISVTVDMYLYPGAKKIGSVTEIGTIQEAELITTNIANQLIPLMTNAMPVLVNINLTPDSVMAKSKLFIDDILQASVQETILLESGVHTIQFVCDGYRNAGTTYYFSGNTTYNIDVNLKEKTEGFIQVQLQKPLLGDFLANGEAANKIDDNMSQIRINGKNILGEFITENGETAFFYIQQNMVTDGNVLNVNPKPFDREKNIDKRRKWMYASYTSLMISLIPTFYSYGNLINEAKRYNDGFANYQEAVKVQQFANVCQGISIGCGVFFVYELIRYLIAANSVLPQNVKQGDISEFKYMDYNNSSDLIDDNEVSTETNLDLE